MLTFGSLFAGIGGFDLGMERAGLSCRWQVEIDEFCNQILAKHWPDVARGRDVRLWPMPDTQWVDIICGGFPCQDISSSGDKVGIVGARSGLWGEFSRIIREVRPRYVVVENVADLVHRGLDTVLGDLANVGFDAWWGLLPAASFGSPQRRLRTVIVAHAHGGGQQRREEWDVYWQGYFLRHHRDGLDLAERAAATCPGRVRRIPSGVSRGVDVTRRIAACGNSIHPAMTEWIGRGLVEFSERN